MQPFVQQVKIPIVINAHLPEVPSQQFTSFQIMHSCHDVLHQFCIGRKENMMSTSTQRVIGKPLLSRGIIQTCKGNNAKFVEGNRGLKYWGESEYEICSMLGYGGEGEVFNCTSITDRSNAAVKFIDSEISWNIKQSLTKVVEFLIKTIVRIVYGGNRFIDQQGADVLVLPKLATIKGDIISELIHGKDGSISIFGYENRKKPVDACSCFYMSEFPEDPQHALIMCAGLLLGVHSLHVEGMVHSDIKLENIMIQEFSPTGSRLDYPHIRIIDFGGINRVGENLVFWSSNAAPEITNAKKKASYENDIYCIGSILSSLLFGACPIRKEGASKDIGGMEFLVDIFIRYKRDDIKSDFYEFAKDKTLEDIFMFFHRPFMLINNEMYRRTGKSYPPEVIRAIAELNARMCAIDPKERPTALECYEILMHLGLSDWRRGHFTVDDMKQTSEVAGHLPVNREG